MLPGQETEEEQQFRALFEQVAGEVWLPLIPNDAEEPASHPGMQESVIRNASQRAGAQGTVELVAVRPALVI